MKKVKLTNTQATWLRDNTNLDVNPTFVENDPDTLDRIACQLRKNIENDDSDPRSLAPLERLVRKLAKDPRNLPPRFKYAY